MLVHKSEQNLKHLFRILNKFGLNTLILYYSKYILGKILLHEFFKYIKIKIDYITKMLIILLNYINYKEDFKFLQLKKYIQNLF